MLANYFPLKRGCCKKKNLTRRTQNSQRNKKQKIDSLMGKKEMESKNKLLQIAGYTNYIIAALHIIGLFWADWMFEVTGIQEDMAELAAVNYWLPYIMTIIVAIFFYIFGRYALSATGVGKKLPLLKAGNYVIGFIYLLRGVGEFFYDNLNDTGSFLGTNYSIVAIIIGLLFLIGTFQVFFEEVALDERKSRTKKTKTT